jgi:hypothetical protein
MHVSFTGYADMDGEGKQDPSGIHKQRPGYENFVRL